ncbi:MAG: hypothetical protein IKJ11_04795 [Clostridia bacterium]|nr:hypothetical protein [Clostridia bacterium]
MAQRRRKEQEMIRRQRIITALCVIGGVGAVLLSVFVCILIFDPFAASMPVSAPAATSLPYSAAEPFSLGDLTTAQITQLRKNGRMAVSDGPRGVSIGDTLEKLMERLPSTIAVRQNAMSGSGMDQSDEEMNQYYQDYLETLDSTERTGMQSEEQIILYCADYFENQNGMMTVLPPRGLIDVDNGEIVVTLLAPTSAYPAGTRDNYGAYEHVYCVYTIDPETMTIASITLGIDQ